MAEFVRHVDANKKKGIFGGAFLVEKKGAAAQAAAQARVFELSTREKALVEELTRREEAEGGGEKC